MRRSKLFSRTTRETPSDAEILSHKLMLKSGKQMYLVIKIYQFWFIKYKQNSEMNLDLEEGL